MELTKILQKVLEIGGSDLFLIPGSPATAKVKGHLVPLTESKLLPEDTAGMIQEAYGMAGGHSDEMLRRDGDDDFSFSFNRQARFRCNAYKQRGTLAATCRVVTFGLPNPDALHIPPMVIDLASSCRNGMVLVTGPAGSGKSTIALLLARLYDPGEGRITIGGVDVKDMDPSELRRGVGVVLQEPFLFSRTVAQNIAITRENVSRDEIEQAAREACLHDAIGSFQAGYETVVGERGVTLSGGQKQRTAIARTLLEHAPIMVFDDALSAVDAKTDEAIRGRLREAAGGSTMILIAHRVATLMQADQIIVLRDGRIVEQGTPEALLTQGGLFARTARMQSAEGKEEAE